MRKGILALAAAGLVVAGGLAACGKSDDSGSSSGSKKAPYVGVILPDTKSSARWETADRPLLKKAFDDAGVKSNIQNAQGDPNAFQTIADQMITDGVNVLVITDLDAGSGTAVIKKAQAAGIPVIDYDRLTIGGGAQYYVSFDNVQVGKLQGQGLQKCLTDEKAPKGTVVAELNGSPDDNNATLFAQGYDSVLNPLYADGTYTKGPNQSVAKWDNAVAGTTFEQMLTSNNKIGGALVANDGMANSVIAVLKKDNLKMPVTGQDATVQGLQHILDGDQCMTVYKAVQLEAKDASELAIALAKGDKPSVTQSVMDPKLNKAVPSRLETPKAIYKDNVKDVVADGYVTKDQLCTGDYAAKCAAAGIS
ncbi:sugar ABC transporter substrate-binding protein [Rugosimonospora africana]|uniref:Sugar ABC transporter substrate-binding protein n=1 Tax=Rugosimonospora africana TaxID=556532 RepID=A0A8J3QJJ2_9ACTN|nr:substrate-binding domain-containing protein [Rugosimonospora africana]GIH12164.1 sugar ABC transporter substrate-binding protein [Rugosimonospora africana]